MHEIKYNKILLIFNYDSCMNNNGCDLNSCQEDWCGVCKIFSSPGIDANG